MSRCRRPGTRSLVCPDHARGPQMIRECVICGAQFRTNCSRHTVCSEECQRVRTNLKQSERRRRNRALAVLHCIECGSSFNPRGPQITCSSECSRKRSNKVRLGWAKANRKTKDVEKRKCISCDSLFAPSAGNQICCSVGCKKERRLITGKKWRLNNREALKDKKNFYRQRHRKEIAEKARIYFREKNLKKAQAEARSLLND